MVQQLSALIVQPAVDASKYTAGAQEKVAADKAMAASSREAGAAATDTSAKINQAGDVLARLSRQYVDGYANEQRFAQGLNQLSRGLDSGKISMEGAERILIGMNQRLGLTADVTQVAAKGQMALASAVERANAQIARQAAELANADTVNRRFHAANSNVISAGQRQAAAFNAGQQLQDIGMMALTGQNVGVLSLQQGPQLATAIQQGGGIGTVVSGLGSLLSLTTLLTIGFTAAGAAAIQWFVKGREGAKSLEDKLKDHSATLSRLKQQYGELGDASKNVGGPVGGITYTEAQARSDVDTLRATIRSQSGDLSKEFIGGGFLRGGLFGSSTGGLDALIGTKNSPFQSAVDDLLKSIRDGNGGLEKFDANLNRIFDDLRGKSSDPAKLAEEMQQLSDAALDAFSVTGKMSPFQGEIDRLLLGLKEGNDDLSTFATNVRRIGELNGIGKQADDAILAAKEVVNLAEKLKEVEQILRRIDQENTRPGLRDQRELRRYVAGRDADARILDQQFAADQQLARARTNAERLAAVEGQVRARAKEDGDSGGGLQARVDRALAEERTRQEVEARDAAIQRSQAIERSLQQQRLELDLIGKTGGEQAKLRYEFERMQELREQAARTGEPIDEKEVANIKAAAEAMGQYADALARAKLSDELQFERDQLGRSDLDQTVASRLRGVGLPADLKSRDAALIRSNELLKRQVDLWKDIRQSGMDAYSDIFDLAFDGFDNWEQRLSDIAKDMAKNLFDLGIKNPFLNQQYGANLPTLDQAGGLPGFIGSMLGMTPNPAAGLGELGTMANPMYVVPVGGMGGEGGILGAVSRLFSPANDNGAGTVAKTAASLIPGGGALASAAGSALSFVGNYKQGVDSRLTDILSEAAKRFGGFSVSAFSGLRPGDPRFHGKGLATDVRLTDLASGKALANYQDPSTFRTYEQFAQVARQVQMEKYPELADKFRWGGYFSGGRGKYGAMDQMHFDLGGGKLGMAGGSWANGLSPSQRAMFPGVESLGMGANKAAQALDMLTTKSTDLNSGFDLLGKGLVGQNGQGGLLSFLGSANFKPNTTLSAYLGAPQGGGGGGGLLEGLFGWIGKLFGFADGTENAPAGWAWVGERGPELRKLRAGDVIRSNSRSMQMAAEAERGGSVVSKTEMHFHNAPAVMHEEESDDGNGGRRMDIWFEEQTAKASTRRGSASNKALTSLGLSRPMKVR